ncbi:rod shape-determining protein MreD [Candidatus Latescibacterota bacterium]
MRIIRNILVIALAFLMQSIFFGRFTFFGVRPDLAMIVLIFLSHESNSVEIVLYGFFIGFFQDVYTPEYLGFNMLTMSFMAYLLDVAKEMLTVENYKIKMLVAFFACLVHDLIYLSLYTQFDYTVLTRLFLRSSLPGAIYTAILAVIFMRAWDWAVKGGLFIVVKELVGIRR